VSKVGQRQRFARILHLAMFGDQPLMAGSVQVSEERVALVDARSRRSADQVELGRAAALGLPDSRWIGSLATFQW
jgi:hypothetical protein